jgi:hypothetical protein
MEAVQADVNSSAPSTEQVVTQAAPDQQPVVETPTPPVPQAVNLDVDEFGVPWKNRAMEFKRRYETTLEEVNSKIDKLATGYQQPKQYSVEELEAFAETTDNAQHKAWAKSQIREIEKKEYAKVAEESVNKWKKEQEVERTKAQVFQSVLSRNPDVAIKDQNGNFLGFNPNSPVFQRMNQYMNNPEIANHPKGLEIAEAYAIRDLHLSQAPKAAQVLVNKESEIKNLQKKTLIEGGGQPVPQSNPKSAMMDRLKQTGTVKDGAAIFKEMLKSQGVISE